MDESTIQWTKELKTHIIWQDQQHQYFILKIRKLFQAFYHQRGHLDINNAIKELEHYADDHFGLEELYMAAVDYPELHQHCGQHDQFRSFLEDLKKNRVSDVMDSARLCNKLFEWFSNHIRVVDQRLGLYLREKSQL